MISYEPTYTNYYSTDYDSTCSYIYPTKMVIIEIDNPYPFLDEKEKDPEYYAWKAEIIRDLARLSRNPMSPAVFYLVFHRPFLIRRRILRCNRHGIGLRMGIK